MTDLRLEGLALNCRPLGENDRLLSLLSEEQGILRLAVPGARRPKSSLAAAVPLSHLQLQVSRGRSLPRVRQLQVLRSYGALGQQLESLAGAQALAELCLALVPAEAPAPGMLTAMLMHLGRLEDHGREPACQLEALATAVQGSVHLLALGGYGLPLGTCVRTGQPLEPPLGQWDWRCSLLSGEGLVLGAVPGAAILLNPSELALLQRLVRPALPRRRDGALLGPSSVWLHLLELVCCWCDAHLGRRPRAFRLLRGSWAGAS